uniref:Uncharacterized protein n=1 Tax=Heliothis virescens TaxID=7102 RepID=A0A2A4IWX5_HELVI
MFQQSEPGVSVSPVLDEQVECGAATVPAGHQTEQTPADTSPDAASEPPNAASEPLKSASEPPNASSQPPDSASEPSDAASEPPNGASEPPDGSSEPPKKKMKVDGVCATCLGLLQPENWPQSNAMVKEMLDKKRFYHDTFFQDSDGSGSIASTASRSSPLPYDTVRKLPSVPTSASLPAAESRESLVRPRDSSLPSPSKLAVYAAARRRSAESAKDNNKRTHHYRIQF